MSVNKEKNKSVNKSFKKCFDTGEVVTGRYRPRNFHETTIQYV